MKADWKIGLSFVIAIAIVKNCGPMAILDTVLCTVFITWFVYNMVTLSVATATEAED